jgi:hypothetical protein
LAEDVKALFSASQPTEKEVSLEPRKDCGIEASLNVIRPVAAIVIKTAHTWEGKAKCILGSGDLLGAGRILAGEQDLRQFLGIAGWEAIPPQPLGCSAGACCEAGAGREFRLRLQREDDDRPGMQLRYKRLVKPAASEVNAIRQGGAVP